MALDLYEETLDLLRDFTAAGVPYALVGGIALAIHGVPRATVDIDVLVQAERLSQALESRRRGFIVAAMPMRFSDGMELRRVTRIDADEAITLISSWSMPNSLASGSRGSRRPRIAARDRRFARGLIQMKAAAGRPGPGRHPALAGALTMTGFHAAEAVTARLREAALRSDLRQGSASKVDMSSAAVSERLRQQSALRSASLRWAKSTLLER